MTDVFHCASEKAWFFNHFGQPGRWITADLYLEQCNYWVKASKLLNYFQNFT